MGDMFLILRRQEFCFTFSSRGGMEAEEEEASRRIAVFVTRTLCTSCIRRFPESVASARLQHVWPHSRQSSVSSLLQQGRQRKGPVAMPCGAAVSRLCCGGTGFDSLGRRAPRSLRKSQGRDGCPEALRNLGHTSDVAALRRAPRGSEEVMAADEISADPAA